MASGTKDQLFRLIKSLNKAEKRNFRLYAGRTGGSQPSKFVQLFDALDKLDDYNEEVFLRRLDGVEKQHLPNLKRHLYREILASLRLIHIQKEIDIEIREQIDFARILYGKGLFMDSLRILERIKQVAERHHQDILHLEILEFQKLIEARHITRSRQIGNKMDLLLNDSTQRSAVTLSTSELFNVNIKIHGYYIEHGHARTPAERHRIREYWNAIQPIAPDALTHDTFFEKVNRFQAKMWYHYILLELPLAWENASEWVNLFWLYPQMTVKDPDLYMRGLYYLLIFSFLLERRADHKKYLSRLRHFVLDHQEEFNQNSRQIAFVYLNLARLNAHLLQSNIGDAHRVSREILEQLPLYENGIDEHRRMLFFYKLAYIHFARDEHEQALDYINDIINLKGNFLRDDIHINTRLLSLFCHYELGHYSLLDSLLTSAQRLLHRSTETGDVHQLGLSLIRQLVRQPLNERTDILRQYSQHLARLEQDPYERKALMYFNLRGWIDRSLDVQRRGMAAAQR